MHGYTVAFWCSAAVFASARSCCGIVFRSGVTAVAAGGGAGDWRAVSDWGRRVGKRGRRDDLDARCV